MRLFIFICTFIPFFTSLYGITYEPNELKHKQLLDIKKLKDDPLELLLEWYQSSQKKPEDQTAAAVILSTVDQSCEPSARAMIAKNIDKNGITFLGDLRSSKFQDLKNNPAAAITIVWFDLQKQVRVVGKATPISKQEAQEVFDKRNKMSRISTHASHQGDKIENIKKLKEKHAQLAKQYENKSIPIPAHWGGYRIVPERMIFWEAGPYNLHSRVLFEKKEGKWQKTAIAP